MPLVGEEQIGWIPDPTDKFWVPLYPPKRGAIVTQAFIRCSECGKTICHNSGPRSNALCMSCYGKGERGEA